MSSIPDINDADIFAIPPVYHACPKYNLKNPSPLS